MLHWLEQSDAELNTSTLDFETLWRSTGQLFRNHKNRQTLKIQIQNHFYFLKKQDKTHWFEYVKNFIQGKKPAADLISEWKALQFCKQNHLYAPQPLIYGKQQFLFRNRSLILMSAIEPAISLETLTLQYPQILSFKLVRWFIKTMANTLGKLHAEHWHHRDCYLCHFLLPLDLNTQDPNALHWADTILKEKPNLFLIDWHRAGQHHPSSTRWRIKDLAGLYFSSKHLPLKSRDFFYFIKHYYGIHWKTQFKKNKSLFVTVIKKGEALYEKHRH